ncbi:hypothetical protein SARC_15367, partial [Sphaeroforma arctica JP610]
MCGFNLTHALIWPGHYALLHTIVGKNDGSVQDVRYFECTAKHGSFIRQSQVQPLHTPTPVVSTPTQTRVVAGGSSIPTRVHTPTSPATTRSPTSRLPRPGATSSVPRSKATPMQEPRIGKASVSPSVRAGTSSASPNSSRAGAGTKTPAQSTTNMQTPAGSGVRAGAVGVSDSRLANSPRASGATPHAQKNLVEPITTAVVDDGEVLRLTERITELEQQKAQEYKDHERTRLALEQVCV